MYHVGIDERHEHESPANSRYDGVRTLSVLDVTRKRRTGRAGGGVSAGWDREITD